MTIEEFATVTRRVIAAEGFVDFLPTACYPDRGEVVALQGLPPDVEPESAVLRWAAKRAKAGELHLVAFRSGPAQFTVVRVQGPERESDVFAVALT
jgi:hypothetical protein